MTPEELKLRCLELAVARYAGAGDPIRDAEKMFEFLTGEEPKPDLQSRIWALEGRVQFLESRIIPAHSAAPATEEATQSGQVSEGHLRY